jgi:osmotically inducible lipoprotein OsmB
MVARARGVVATRKYLAVAAVAALPLVAGACAFDGTTRERTGTGAAINAASGAAIGLLRGDSLGSALAGAAAGAAGGFVYDQIERW